jgi:phospholipid/cholesterol/gamma-HCH transport system ATP-binding protein
MKPIAIKVDQVIKRYGERTILDAITLDVFEGETLVILGGSGSGKSTLLRLMMGTVKPNGGDVIAFGLSQIGRRAVSVGGAV